MIFNKVVQESEASIEKRDLDKVVRLLEPYSPKRILEIGMWKGYSADNWIKIFDPDFLVTIEKDRKHPDGVYHEDNPNYHYLWETDSTSDQTLDKIKDLMNKKQFDMAFIDGGHDYATIRRDLQLYIPLVRPGGVVVMHDILYMADACQVKLYWEYLKKHHDYVEINCGLGSTGIGMIFIGNKYGEKITENPRQ